MYIRIKYKYIHRFENKCSSMNIIFLINKIKNSAIKEKIPQTDDNAKINYTNKFNKYII